MYSKEIDRKRTLHICPTWHRSRSLWNPPPEAHWNEQILLHVEKNRKMFRSDHDKERCQDRMDRNHNVRSSHLCSLTDTFCSCCWAKTYVHAIRSWWGTDTALATSILYHINNKFNLHFQNKISPDHIQIQKRKLPILHRASRIGTVFFFFQNSVRELLRNFDGVWFDET